VVCGWPNTHTYVHASSEPPLHYLCEHRTPSFSTHHTPTSHSYSCSRVSFSPRERLDPTNHRPRGGPCQRTRSQRDHAHTHLRWQMMALAKPLAFCDSYSQDGAAWTLLVRNRSRPLVSFCAHRNEAAGCSATLANVNPYLAHLARTEFDLMSPSDAQRGV
jgi:hypothetical protein